MDPRWDGRFFQRNSAFDVIADPVRRRCQQLDAWPEVTEYRQLVRSAADPGVGEPSAADRSVVQPGVAELGCGDLPVRFELQSEQSVRQAGGYEAYVARHGVVPTRSRNWHDLLNAMMWGQFPKSKLALNQLQLSDLATQRSRGERTPRQAVATHFDELGLLLISQEVSLLEAIAELRWQDALLQRREEFGRQVRAVVFGHGLLEAMLEPHDRVLGKALLIHGEPDEAQLDAGLAATIRRGVPQLAPVPVLGLPGFFAAADSAAFFDNTNYFRTRRRRADVRPPTVLAFDPGGFRPIALEATAS